MRGMMLLAVVGGIACSVCADEPKPELKPAEKSKPSFALQNPKADEPKKPEAKKPGDDGKGFPPKVEKNLWAETDLRGKPMVDWKPQEWLNGTPKTEGKVVLIDVWATWCGPCKALIPELEAFAKEFAEDLVVVGISAEAKHTVDMYLAKRPGGGVSYYMGIDGSAKLNKGVGIDGIPHVFIVGSDGIVRWQGFPQSEEDPLNSTVIKRIIEADKFERAERAKREKAKEPEAKPAATPPMTPPATEPKKP